jgi:hypothetical protein
MTITQHALLYNFHTSNLIFEEIFFLKFLSMQPLDMGSQGLLWSENDAMTSWLRLIPTSDHFIHPY